MWTQNKCTRTSYCRSTTYIHKHTSYGDAENQGRSAAIVRYWHQCLPGRRRRRRRRRRHTPVTPEELNWCVETLPRHLGWPFQRTMIMGLLRQRHWWSLVVRGKIAFSGSTSPLHPQPFLHFACSRANTRHRQVCASVLQLLSVTARMFDKWGWTGDTNHGDTILTWWIHLGDCTPFVEHPHSDFYPAVFGTFVSICSPTPPVSQTLLFISSK